MQRYVPFLLGAQFVLIAILFVLVLRSSQTPSAGTDTSTQALIEDLAADSLGGLFTVNFDSLKTNYTYYREAKAALDEQLRQFEVRLQQRQQELATAAEQFEADVRRFQQNPSLQTNAEAARLQAREQELLKQRQNLDAFAQRGQQQLADVSAEKNRELFAKIEQFLAQLNADGRYKIVLSYSEGSGVLYAYPGLDITQVVIAGLNAEYAAQTGKSAPK